MPFSTKIVLAVVSIWKLAFSEPQNFALAFLEPQFSALISCNSVPWLNVKENESVKLALAVIVCHRREEKHPRQSTLQDRMCHAKS